MGCLEASYRSGFDKQQISGPHGRLSQERLIHRANGASWRPIGEWQERLRLLSAFSGREPQVDGAVQVAYYQCGSACGLVSVRDFKSCGSASGRSVGSIPTHFRQILKGRAGGWLPATAATSTMGRRKLQRFQPTKEVKRQARLRLGSPPASQTHADKRKRQPRHKKRERQILTEEA
jgi:hypothetical protein